MDFAEMQKIIPYMTEGKQIYSKVAQIVIRKFYNNISVLTALKKIGKKVGPLRFKSRNQFKSFTYNQSGSKIFDDCLQLSKVGKIKMVLHRPIVGVKKEVFVKRCGDKWFAIIVSSALRQQSITTTEVKKSVGIDVGIHNFAYDSDGKITEHPQILKESAKKLSRIQRVFSRRKDGSKNKSKQGVKLKYMRR